MLLDFDTLSPTQIYHTMTQALIPRPIAWVLSDNGDGGYNLAPFSYFNAVASDPPLLMLSIGRKPGGEPKDTRRNILERKDFVVHIADHAMIDAVNASAAGLPAGASEVSKVQLPLCRFEGFRLPRLSDSPVAMACELYKVDEITASQAMVLGRVRRVYIRDAAVSTDNKGRNVIEAAKIDPISRLGASEYALLGEILTRPRPL